jgi:hypothetical protein
MADPRTRERLRQLLEAYGADAERWPAGERDAALASLARSPEMRAEHAAAARLDRVLDLAPAAQPSPALVAAVLAAAPRGRRTSRVRRLSVAIPLAIAAALLMWIVRDRGAAPRALTDEVIAELGRYSTPTDVLLASPDEVLDTMPAVGCAATWLGCSDLEKRDPKESIMQHTERIRV